jgi:hypothetical protein
MEDKWDVYLFEARLYFCRSWTGELIYRTQGEFFLNGMSVKELIFAVDIHKDGATMAVRSVDSRRAHSGEELSSRATGIRLSSRFNGPDGFRKNHYGPERIAWGRAFRKSLKRGFDFSFSIFDIFESPFGLGRSLPAYRLRLDYIP